MYSALCTWGSFILRDPLYNTLVPKPYHSTHIRSLYLQVCSNIGLLLSSFDPMSPLLPFSSYGTSTPVTILRSNRTMSTKLRCLGWIGILSQRMRLYRHHGIIRSRFVLPYFHHLHHLGSVPPNVPQCVCVRVCVLRKGGYEVMRRVSCM